MQRGISAAGTVPSVVLVKDTDWQGQLKDQTGFLVSASLTLHSAPH